MSEWRLQEARRGPAFTERSGPLDLPTEVYTVTGRLHLYDSDSERTYAIKTILAQCTGGRAIVYPRSTGSDRDRKSQLLVKADAIRDAYWAFRKRIQQ